MDTEKMIDPTQVKHWRKELMGVTREQLGGVLGVTGQTIFRWETAENPFCANRKTLKDLLDLMANPAAYEILRRNEYGIPTRCDVPRETSVKPHQAVPWPDSIDLLTVPERVFELYDWARQLNCEWEFVELISGGATMEQLRMLNVLHDNERLELENNELRKEIEALKGGE